MSTPGEHEIECPCCGATLVVDAATGTVLHHVPKPVIPQEKKLDHALEQLAEESKKLESKFDSAMSSQKHRKTALDRAFEKAHDEVRKEVEEKGQVERPPSIFDAD